MTFATVKVRTFNLDITSAPLFLFFKKKKKKASSGEIFVSCGVVQI